MQILALNLNFSAIAVYSCDYPWRYLTRTHKKKVPEKYIELLLFICMSVDF